MTLGSKFFRDFHQNTGCLLSPLPFNIANVCLQCDWNRHKKKIKVEVLLLFSLFSGLQVCIIIWDWRYRPAYWDTYREGWQIFGRWALQSLFKWSKQEPPQRLFANHVHLFYVVLYLSEFFYFQTAWPV